MRAAAGKCPGRLRTMDLGAALHAILFVCLSVAQVMIGFIVLSYAAHAFLVVTVDTAAGNERVAWPDEPLVDWFWQFFYLAWLAALWLVPAWFLAALVARRAGWPAGGWQTFAFSGVVFWLAYPVGLLSSLSGAYRWTVLRPAIVGGMCRSPVAAAIYYAVSALLLAGWGWLFYETLTASALAVPVSAMAGAAVVLMLARLLGRLALRLSLVRRRPKKRRRGAPKRSALPALEAHDPWDMPEAPPPAPPPPSEPPAPPPKKRGRRRPWDEDKEEGGVYGLAGSVPSPAAPKPPEDVPLPEGYAVADAPPPPPLPPLQEAEEDEPQTVAAPRPRRKPGTRRPPAVASGVLLFPWTGDMLKRWIALSLGFVIMELLLLGQITFFPFRE